MALFGGKKNIRKLNEDIIRLKDNIDKIEKEYSRVQGILNSMAEAVIAVDQQTRVVVVNPATEKIFGISSGQTRGKFFLEVIPNNDISEIINAVLSNNEPLSKELSLIWPVQKIFHVNASPIIEKNEASGCLLVIHDITEIRNLERMRSDFVANVSHELKTPLTSIKGFVETLLGGALEDKENASNFLEIIQKHVERLSNLINDLLDLSSLESKTAGLNKGEADLQKISDKVLSGFKSQLKKKGIEARNNLPVKLTVNIDANKIEQVLTNLIDNAIKFNKEKGWINLDFQDSYRDIKIIVEDSGVGIPPKDIPRIFERFYRVDKARSRELGGTGLGLSIVKHIIELHGGVSGVESTEGLGSKFWFTLPK